MIKYKRTLFNKILENIIICDESFFTGDVLTMTFKNSFNYFYKFKVFNDMILNNYFIDNTKSEEFIKYFLICQKHYYSFKKLYYNYSYKKTPFNHAINCDLFFNELSSIKPVNKIYIIESNVIYSFTIVDLKKIICSAVTKSDNIFSIPIFPKNPYTNIDISYHNLYNIYFYYIYNNFIIPTAFYFFYKCDFNLNELKTKYEAFLREQAIKNYYENMGISEKACLIKYIIGKYKNIIPLTIHRNFSDNEVVINLNHVIFDYLKTVYSLQPNIRLKHKSKLERNLQSFYNKNKYFGIMKPFISDFSNNIVNTNNNLINNPFIFGLSNVQQGEIPSNISILNNNNINNNINEEENNISDVNTLFSIERNIFNIMDDNTNETVTSLYNNREEIINNQMRIREMLAGDDESYDDYEGYTE